MRKIYIYALATALLALAGCEKGTAPEDAGGITVRASVGPMTRVQYSGNGTEFTSGDQIAVYAWTGGNASGPAKCVVNGVVNTFDGTAWTPADQMEWDGLTEAHYFLGITPVAAVTDFTAGPYTLNPADYTASDLLIATNLEGITPSATPVDLAFTHAMAKLNVNLKFRTEWDVTPSVSGVTVTARKTATVNYLTKAVTATGAPEAVDIPAAATAATGYALSFSGLQVPQEGVRRVAVIIGGKEYVYESATDIPLVGGQYITLNLEVGQDFIRLGSMEVADWEDLAVAVGHAAPAVSLQELVYMGNPAIPDTVSCGNDLVVRLRVNPSNVSLTENLLTVQQVDRKQFFLSGTDLSQAVKDHFPSFTLEKDPEAEGQYLVRVRTLVDEVYKYWDETSLIFKYMATDEDGNPKYFSTPPVPVVILPNPKDGLSLSGRENTASFLMGKLYGKEMKRELGIIYQPLVSIVFRNGSDTRTYSAEYLSKATFRDSNDYLKVKTVIDRQKHFVGIVPDTTDIAWLPLYDSTRVRHYAVNGYLELHDRWGGSTGEKSPALSGITWYTAYADTVLADPTISSDGKLTANLASKATKLGLNLGEHPGGTYCDVRFDYASASGAWLSASFKPYSWDLEMQLMTFPSGSRFTVDAVISQYVQPSENTSMYRPMQRKVRIRVTFTVK
jgi:hypothetical protein